MDEVLDVAINIFLVGTAIGAVSSTVWKLMEQMSLPLQTIGQATAPLSQLSSFQRRIQDLETLEETLIKEAIL